MQQLKLSITALCAGLFCAAAQTSSPSGPLGATPGTSGSGTGGAAMTKPMPAGTSAPMTNGRDGIARSDRVFVSKAAMGGMGEVELGKLAQQKASNDQVKQFGAKMVEDHTKANDELKQIASSKGIDVPATVDRKSQSEMNQMQKLSGASFDRAYMRHMVADHKKDIADFKKEANGGRDAELKGFASKTLPTLQEHLQMAQAANAAVSGAKSSK